MVRPSLVRSRRFTAIPGAVPVPPDIRTGFNRAVAFTVALAKS